MRYRLHQFLTPKQLAIVETCAIGLVAAIAAVVLKETVGWLGGWRLQIARDLPAWLALPGIGLCGGFLSGFLVEEFAPEAAGSGIPQVKAVLGDVPMALNLRVAAVKLAGTILSLSSGMALGRQGPTVQIGAALAAQVSEWWPASPDYRRQLIAAGAAAGLAAGFNAPIAGVLFAIEELLGDVSNQTMGTAILASFVGGVVSRLLGGQSLNLDRGFVMPQSSFYAQEIPLFLLLGILVGGSAALFNHGMLASLQWNKRLFPLSLRWRVAIAGGVSGLTVAVLPVDFRDGTGLQAFLAMGQSWQIAAGAFVVRFFLTLIASSAETPGGLFAPSLVLGAALGALVGGLGHTFVGAGSTVTYALAGMGAFLEPSPRYRSPRSRSSLKLPPTLISCCP